MDGLLHERNGAVRRTRGAGVPSGRHPAVSRRV